jgi:hypothetical protein
MPESPNRDEQDPPDRKPASGPRLTGRDFAGASFAANEREQTADHRGESQQSRVDDTPRADGEREEIPRDES